MITRRIGGFIRGKATPFQLFSGCVLASMAAFLPGFSQAPGLVIFWVVLLVVLNANLFMAGVVGAAAKILSLLLVPVSFAIGRFLLEGPTEGLFSALVNAPVFAWFGFEYYVVPGGQLLGLVFGVVCGVVAVKFVRLLWKKFAAMEKDNEAYQKWSNNRWVKIGAFVFVGGVKGKKSFTDLHAQKMGNPIRVSGAILVVAVLVVAFIAVRVAQGPLLASTVRSGLEQANGATVDLERAELDLTAGKMSLFGLALADRDKLSHNLFAASSIEAKLSTADLLRRRAALDEVVIVGGVEGGERETPGERIGKEPGNSEWSGMEVPDAKSLEDLMKNADVWKERLSTARRWLDKLGGSSADEKAAGPTYEDILRERVRLLGYANVRNDALIEKAPTFLIRKLEAAEVKASQFPDDPLTIEAENLSTQPKLVEAPPTISVVSASGRLQSSFSLPQNAEIPGANLDLVLKGIEVDSVVSQLSNEGGALVSGGTMDVSVKGLVSAIDSNLPLKVTLHNTNLSIGGSKPTKIPELTVPIAVRGPIDNPAIKVEQSGLKTALVSAGKQELSNRLGGELQKQLGGETKEGEEPAKLEDTAKSVLDGFLKPKEKKKE